MKTPLRNKALNHLLDGLRNLGCNYLVIDHDGSKHEHGSVTNKRGRVKKRHPHGAIRGHYQPFIEGLNPGDSIEIPSNGFDLTNLQSGVSSKCLALFGRGAVMTRIKRDTDSLEVLRVL